MSFFKLIVVRKDGIIHTSQFSGWFAETACYKHFNDVKQHDKTLVAVIFDGISSENSSDVIWTPRTSVNVDEL
jgi:hypothetical protein